MPHPSIKPNILEIFLYACTTQVPKYHPSGKNIHTNTRSGMGYQLWFFISEFYIPHIENQIFSTIKMPKINICYVDDILNVIKNTNQKKNKLKQTLEKKKLGTKVHY